MVQLALRCPTNRATFPASKRRASANLPCLARVLPSLHPVVMRKHCGHGGRKYAADPHAVHCRRTRAPDPRTGHGHRNDRRRRPLPGSMRTHRARRVHVRTAHHSVLAMHHRLRVGPGKAAPTASGAGTHAPQTPVVVPPCLSTASTSHDAPAMAGTGGLPTRTHPCRPTSNRRAAKLRPGQPAHMRAAAREHTMTRCDDRVPAQFR